MQEDSDVVLWPVPGGCSEPLSVKIMGHRPDDIFFLIDTSVASINYIIM